jgi:hypothetical protein
LVVASQGFSTVVRHAFVITRKQVVANVGDMLDEQLLHMQQANPTDTIPS